MNILMYVGLDVHSTSHSIAIYDSSSNGFPYEHAVSGDPNDIVKFLNMVKELNPSWGFKVGYEAGCLGKSVYNSLKRNGYDCVIMAPTTIAVPTQDRRKKNDRSDARNIAKSLAFGTYKSVYIGDDHDDEVRDYIRMRDDLKRHLKQAKQELNSFLMHIGLIYGKSKWTPAHLAWIKSLELTPLQRLTADGYLTTINQLSEQIQTANEQIATLANEDRYKDKVQKLVALKGIRTQTAMTILSEIGDFDRFPTANAFVSYIGLIPSEYSSGEKIQNGAITKSGNSHCRMALIESTQSIVRGKIGSKSKALKARQKGSPSEIIEYADYCAVRLMRRFYKLASHKRYNVAVVAVARELACFIWGIMTDHITVKTVVNPS